MGSPPQNQLTGHSFKLFPGYLLWHIQQNRPDAWPYEVFGPVVNCLLFLIRSTTFIRHFFKPPFFFFFVLPYRAFKFYVVKSILNHLSWFFFLYSNNSQDYIHKHTCKYLNIHVTWNHTHILMRWNLGVFSSKRLSWHSLTGSSLSHTAE